MKFFHPVDPRLHEELGAEVRGMEERMVENVFAELRRSTEEFKEKMQKLLDELVKVVKVVEKVANDAQIEVRSGDLAIVKRKWVFGSGKITSYIVTVNDKLIPSEINDIGGSTYVYGDFNNYEEFASVEEIVYAAENIENLILKLKNALKERSEALDELLSKLNI